MDKLKTILTILLLMFTFGSYAQSIMVAGKVTDTDGVPLIGALVTEANTTNATVTNSKGEYQLKVASKESSLVYSLLGMDVKTEQVGNRGIIDVSLTESVHALAEVEVVAVGYGTMRRSDLTGSVTTVNTDILSQKSVVSLEDAMRGRAAGVQIVQNDGAPGSDYTIRIRGASSVNASSSPIFVIDGVIFDDASFLNSGDVESIEILKDASAAAIYGSRGANGVIIVTTKQGHEGRTTVDLYANVGFQESTNLYNMMNSSEYALSRWKASWKYYPFGTDPSSFIDGDVYRDNPNGDGNYWVLPDNKYKDWKDYASPDSINTDWQDALLRRAMFQEYRVNVAGGNKETKFSVSGGVLDKEGVVKESGFKRFTGRVNFTQKLHKNVTLFANISASKEKYEGLSTGSHDGIIMKILRQPPTRDWRDDHIIDEETESGGLMSNPYRQVRDITFDRLRDKMTARIMIEYNISPKFLFRASGMYDDNHHTNEMFYPKNTEQGFKQNGRVILSNNDIKKMVGEAFLFYINRWTSGHRLKVMVGSTIEDYKNKGSRIENHDFPSLNLGVNSIGMGANPQIPTNSIVEQKMVSFLSRVEYNYKDRYLITASFREDGSSRFGSGNKWAGFPSFAVAWRINEESFLKGFTTLDNLKLRAGYGRSGNTAIPAYRSLSTIGNSFHPMDGINPNYGAVIDRAANPSLRWETTDMFNVGLDAGFFNNRLNFTLDWYNKETTNLLLEKNAPLTSGYDKGWANIGSIRNRGFEVTLGALPILTRNWEWGIDFNIGVNNSKVLDIGPGGKMGFDPGVIAGSGNFVMIQKGHSLGQWYGYEIDGVYNSRYEIEEHGLTEVLGQKRGNIRPGDYRFKDQNGDNIINAKDLTVLGRGEPKFSGGLASRVSYKNLTLSFSLQFSYGAKVFNANLHSLTSGRDGHNQIQETNKAWSPNLWREDGSLFMPGSTNQDYRMPGGVALNFCTSKMLEDGSFLRIGDITISYKFNRKITNKLRMKGLEIFASVNNVHTFTKYSGYDPEVNTRQGQTGDLMPSLDFSAYPRARTYSAGLNIKF